MLFELFFYSVCGGVGSLLFCQDDYSPILETSLSLTRPQCCCFIEYGICHRRDNEITIFGKYQGAEGGGTTMGTEGLQKKYRSIDMPIY